eukprot:4814789-Pyramimonas_sp.AAC.1
METLRVKAPDVYRADLGRTDPEEEVSLEWRSPWEYSQKAKQDDLVGYSTEDKTGLAVLVGFTTDEKDLGQLEKNPERMLAALVKQNK